ncbi:hypothetical protein REC12_04880 [Desulfosporosinus sp. PR]|nr:hypothetical protein [Desulfosporosinus sp. PR]
MGNMISSIVFIERSSFFVLHDIGRREGIKSIMHTIDGYDYMMSLNQKEIARVCLTHSYPIKDVNTFFGNLIAQKNKRLSCHAL